MKKLILVLTASVFIAGGVFTSCNSSSSQRVEEAQKNVVKANNALDSANKAYQADIAAYRQEKAAMIAANDQNINDFKAKIEHDKKLAKADYKKKIVVLDQKNKDMKKKLDDYKEEGKENWAKFKAEFNHDMSELGQAFKDLTVKNVK